MEPEVQTKAGRLQGVRSRGVIAFHGVPYAKPPVGKLRFRGPRKPESWQGTRPAGRPGPVPVQASLPVFTFLNAGGARQSEDCLYLNVWTPALDGQRRPVLVWIHGGGFLIGAGSTPIYDGHALARSGDIVVVTINYRLGALGFLHLDRLCNDADADSANLGTRDQIAALEWVRDNVESFGGDPENVTVFGQSAGAMSIGALVGAPRARALFHRAILQSGAGDNVVLRDEGDEIAEHFLDELGDAPRSLAALSKIPVSKILRAQGAVNRKTSSLEQLMSLVPCVDGELITERPLDAILGGALRDHDVMIGTTLDEWKLFSPLDAVLSERAVATRFSALLPRVARNAPEPNAALRQYREAVRTRGGETSPFNVWASFQSTRVFHHPASRLAMAQSLAGGTVYNYLFTWQPPALSGTLGACHAIELPFVFGFANHPVTRPLRRLTAASTRLSKRMQRSWTAFARSGDPSHEHLPEWDRFERSSRATMMFDRECSIADHPLEGELGLFEAWT